MLRDDPRVVLRLVGFLRPSAALAAFAHRIERVPLHDFLNLQRLIGGVEFNIVPLRANDFTNCKSELKYFEAAIVGTATLAAPTHAFRAAIADGDNGWLVPSYGWEEALRTASPRWTITARWRSARSHARARYRPRRWCRRSAPRCSGRPIRPRVSAARPRPVHRIGGGQRHGGAGAQGGGVFGRIAALRVEGAAAGVGADHQQVAGIALVAVRDTGRDHHDIAGGTATV